MSGLPRPEDEGLRLLEVLVLGGEAKVVGPGVNAAITGDISHALIACLASAWPDYLRRWEIAERIDWSPSEEALQKHVRSDKAARFLAARRPA